jgi:hypothetical protein
MGLKVRPQGMSNVLQLVAVMHLEAAPLLLWQVAAAAALVGVARQLMLVGHVQLQLLEDHLLQLLLEAAAVALVDHLLQQLLLEAAAVALVDHLLQQLLLEAAAAGLLKQMMQMSRVIRNQLMLLLMWLWRAGRIPWLKAACGCT